MAETWKKMAFEDDVLLKSVFNAQSIVMATDDDTPIVLEVAEQEVIGRLTGGTIDGIALGIADNNVAQIDQGDIAEHDIASFTTAGLKGLSYAELLAALSGDAGAAFDWNLQQIQNFLIHIVADDTAKTALTATVGQLVWQTDNTTLYFCTEGE